MRAGSAGSATSGRRATAADRGACFSCGPAVARSNQNPRRRQTLKGPTRVPRPGVFVKRAALCILALLVGSTALAPFAAADGGLALIVFVTPEGRSVGQTVDVNVETYVNGVATDVETLSVQAGIGGTDINFTNVSAGKYHATLTINAGDVLMGSLYISGSADLGALSESIFDTYSVGGGSASGWEVTLRTVAGGQQFVTVAPGANVLVEARTYLDGNLADGGPVNMTLQTTNGMDFGASPAETPLTSTKLSDGVFQATIQVPNDITLSKSFQVKAWLGSNITGPSETTLFFAHPFTVMSFAESSTATSAVLKVFAGSASPIAGANISLSGLAITMGLPPSITTVGPFTATTDANGKATLNPTWSASSTISTWFLNVTSGGKTTSTLVLFGPTTGATSWTPTPAFGFLCEVRLQTDPSSFQPGQTVNMRFRVTNNGTAVASASVFRYAFRDGASATAVAGNGSTDASGDFMMSYAIPANWTGNDQLTVKAVCPSGYTGSDEVQGGSANPFGTGKLTVSASGALGAAVQVTATYSGTNALTNVVATCAIVPGNQTSLAGLGFAAGSLSAPMTRSGSTFTGSINVPLWLGDGNYTVIAFISNMGATSTTSDQTMEGNTTTIHMTPQGSTGGNTNNTGKGFLPGFEAPATVGAVGAIAALLVVGRRRREA